MEDLEISDSNNCILQIGGTVGRVNKSVNFAVFNNGEIDSSNALINEQEADEIIAHLQEVFNKPVSAK